ncbi:MAG: hypothetical protein M3337_03925, partial [Actinomycetota bacterium]|nr:hypothetical protein [Actinomycetota bacterium]
EGAGAGSVVVVGRTAVTSVAVTGPSVVSTAGAELDGGLAIAGMDEPESDGSTDQAVTLASWRSPSLSALQAATAMTDAATATHHL